MEGTKDDTETSLSDSDEAAEETEMESNSVNSILYREAERWAADQKYPRKDKVNHSKLLRQGRQLARSIDLFSGSELSRHLYKTFLFRQSLQRSNKATSHRRGSRTTTSPRHNRIPRKSWTAWPLPPNSALNKAKKKSYVEDISIPYPYLRLPEQRSRGLREIFVGEVLRQSRLRLRASQSKNLRSLKLHEEKASVEGASMDPDVSLEIDDDQAFHSLSSTTQHILSKFDKLLSVLYRARKSYLSFDAPRNHSKSLNRGRTKASKPAETTRTESSRGFQSSAPDSLSAMESRSPTKRWRMSSSNFDPYEKFLRRRGSLGLRDWSDVLGTALLLGFDASIIENTKARCSLLFGETMDFKVLRESDSIPKLPNVLPGISQFMLDGVHRDGFLEPICPEKSWKQRQTLTRGESV